MLSAEAALRKGASPEAYRFALIAGAGGAPDASALLASLETKLSASSIFEIQSDVYDEWPGGDAWSEMMEQAAKAGDVASLRSAARSLQSGRDGPPRTFETAYGIASIAAAAGDRGAADLRDRLSQRFLVRSEQDRDAWAVLVARMEIEVLDTWVDMDLASAFAKKD